MTNRLHVNEHGSVPADGDQRLLWLLMLGMLAVVLVQCLVPYLPEMPFDMDPRSQQAAIPEVAITLTGGAVLNLVGVVLAAAAMAVHVARGGRVCWWSIGLAAAGMVWCFWHMPGQLEDRVRGGFWIMAVAMAVAILHVADHPLCRRWLVAALVAMVLPLTIRAAIYVWVEHPAMVRMFMEGEDAFLQARGWERDSPQHQLYVRRLMYADATGAFGLSNIFGSVMASLTLLAAGLSLSMVSARRWRSLAVTLPAVAAGVVVVYLTRSKGAAMAGAAALLLLVLVWAMGQWRRWAVWSWLPAAGGIALLVLAVTAVLVRGSLGPPETVQGERSVLFRFHYWQGAAAAYLDQPAHLKLLGTGPGGFKQAYLRYKNPLNPEEVTSTHNVFIDYLAMLGVGGLAWSLLLLLWLWRSGHNLFPLDSPPNSPPDSPSVAPSDPPGFPHDPPHPAKATGLQSAGQAQAAGQGGVADRTVWLALGLGGVVFGSQMIIQFYSLLTPEGFAGWLVGLGLFTAVVAMLVSPAWSWPRGGAAIGLFAAAVMLLVHNQIEMTFFHEPAVGIAWLVIAAAAATSRLGEVRGVAGNDVESKGTPKGFGAARGRWSKAITAIAGGWLGVAAGVLVVMQVVPIHRQHGLMQQAAQRLRSGDLPQAVGQLDQAAAHMPGHVQAQRWRVALRLDWANALERMGRPQQAGQIIQQALDFSEQAVGQTRGHVTLLRLRARVLEIASDMLDQSAAFEQALDVWQQVLTANPYGLQDHVAYADMLWQAGRYEQARDIYRRAQKISDWSYLDPAKQLSPREQAMVAQRLAERSGAGEKE